MKIFGIRHAKKMQKIPIFRGSKLHFERSVFLADDETPVPPATPEPEKEARSPSLPEARVLLIGRLQYNILQVTAFLKGKEIVAEGVFTLKDAIPQFSSMRPTHVFISAGFGTARVDGFAKTFTESMGCIFYIFPEDATKDAEAEVKASAITNKMKLNVTGGGVSRIIDAWLKEEFLKLPEELRKKRKKKIKKKKNGQGQEEDEGTIGSVRLMGMGKKSKASGTVKYLGGHEKKHQYKAPDKKSSLAGESVGFATIVSPHFNGYAVFFTQLELPLKPRESRELTEEVTKNLAAHFEASGKEVPPELSIEIKQLEISNDVERFIDMLTADGSGVRFIEGVDSTPVIEASADPDMIAIDIDRIETAQPLDFDLYIRLSINQKYVKYVNAGDSLTEAQKEKLAARDTKKFHIKKEDQAKFERYCTHCFVTKSLKTAG